MGQSNAGENEDGSGHRRKEVAAWFSTGDEAGDKRANAAIENWISGKKMFIVWMGGSNDPADINSIIHYPEIDEPAEVLGNRIKYLPLDLIEAVYQGFDQTPQGRRLAAELVAEVMKRPLFSRGQATPGSPAEKICEKIDAFRKKILDGTLLDLPESFDDEHPMMELDGEICTSMINDSSGLTGPFRNKWQERAIGPDGDRQSLVRSQGECLLLYIADEFIRHNLLTNRAQREKLLHYLEGCVSKAEFVTPGNSRER